MPELPEVEVTLRGLAPHLEGRTVREVVVRHHRLRWPLPPELPQYLRGARIGGLVRRGKYLLAEVLEPDGMPRGWLLMHLGMTGTLRVLPRVAGVPEPGLHDHVDIALEDAVLRFRDPRRFGAMLWHASADGAIEAHPLLARLGVEPFGPAFAGAAGGQLLYRRSRGRSQAIKSFLLAGQAVVGVGNIYASESLFRAGIRPTLEAGRISLERYQRLAEAIRQTLAEAVARGGSTLRDFVGSDGAQGYFQLDYFVYGRADQTCRRCQTPIRHLVQGQRSTFFCPRCQR